MRILPMKFVLATLCLLIALNVCAENPLLVEANSVIPGAARFGLYIEELEGKNIGLVANHASMVSNRHLVDTLLSKGIRITRLFSPEHGFRGDADAGASIKNDIDPSTSIQVVSLYGDKKKPEKHDLRDIDMMLFDLQDVGVRFYTYISTLTYVMQACAEAGIPLKVLDRPNPNGFYIDGPVLNPSFRSFVGMHPVPVVYGLTIGEYGLMVNGEGWLGNGLTCSYSVVPLDGYQRNMICKLTVKPSPNLPDWQSVYLYPSLCFFEGTIVSVGRGTDKPFQIYGHPDLKTGSYIFTPESKPGASTNPPFKGTRCYGSNLAEHAENFAENPRQINLDWLIDSYKILSQRHKFFNSYFNTLAGTDQLRKQIEQGLSAEEIRSGWQSDLERYKQIRKKYLIYNDL